MILSKSGITNVPTSNITGNIGTSPITGAAIAGLDCVEVTGIIYTVDAAGPACRVTDDTLLTTAIGDMETAYVDAAGRPIPDFTEIHAGNLSGKILVPGLYKWGTAVSIDNTGVTISGGPNNVWIFQISQDLIVADGAIVTLTGGAQAQNIFWQVGGETVLGTTVQFKGIILSQTLVSMNTNASLLGRAYAHTEVTLNKNAVTKPN